MDVKEQGIKVGEIVEALRAISTKNSISSSVYKDAAALIERQAAQLAIMTEEWDAAKRALMQMERLERYYLKQASGRHGAGEGEQNV